MVAVTKLDRLARSVRHLTTMAAVEALGVDLVVVDQGIDTSTPAGRLMFNVLGAIAEFERDLIRERVSAGIAAAKRRGVKLGRPRRLSDAKAALLERLVASRQSVRAIAKALDVSKDVVAREIARRGLRVRAAA